MESPPATFRSSVLISGSLGNTMSMSTPAVQQELHDNQKDFKGTASADAYSIYIYIQYIPHWTRTKNDKTKRPEDNKVPGNNKMAVFLQPLLSIVQYRRYFQHAHFIPIVGVGKRGEY